MTLADALVRNSIGLDAFQRFADLNNSNYPPHNIERLDEHRFRLTLAVAGFGRDDLEILLHGGVLSIHGIKRDEAEQKFLYRGIALRDFTRQFKLGEWVEVSSALLENGLLILELDRRLPEAQRPKTITIG
jgi:molecular chaperone IbpA